MRMIPAVHIKLVIGDSTNIVRAHKIANTCYLKIIQKTDGARIFHGIILFEMTIIISEEVI